jgi:hypothetical protein
MRDFVSLDWLPVTEHGRERAADLRSGAARFDAAFALAHMRLDFVRTNALELNLSLDALRAGIGSNRSTSSRRPRPASVSIATPFDTAGRAACASRGCADRPHQTRQGARKY